MESDPSITAEPLHATRNACKVCAPLGAAMVFKGVRNCLPFLHGSQGCATYIRRYIISHFREPVDIASSSFTEEDAIFGGSRNFKAGVDNAISQYAPEVVGVATTCLSETIGENMIGMIRDCQKDAAISSRTPIVHASTPAYSGSHSEGFHTAVKAMVQHFAKAEAPAFDAPTLNLMPGMVSCADLRELREIAHLFGMNSVMLPDYSDTLEGESWDEYHRISPGGTSISDIASMSKALGSVEMGHTLTTSESAGVWLEKNFNVPLFPMGLPIGLRANDKLMAALAAISGNKTPGRLLAQRGRLLDSYVDAHKYLSGVKVAVVGDPDLVIAHAGFLSEIGARPVICACGTKPKKWKDLLEAEMEGGIEDVRIMPGSDHNKLDEVIRELKPDLIIGASKVAPTARSLKIPHVRTGFPIHDRFGAQRQLSVGYKGTQILFDIIVNALLEHRQNSNSIGYSYL